MKGRLSGWNLLKDQNWQERLEQIKNGHPGPAYVQPHKETLPSPIASCDPDCTICQGKAFYIDSQECAIECPNARRKLSGGGDD